MISPVKVTITGAAGNIGYALAFRVASGAMFGPDQPVILRLLEIPQALDALKGVVMELDDCAFTTLAGVVATDDPNVAFKDSDYALLVGAKPRGPGMERNDLLEANAAGRPVIALGRGGQVEEDALLEALRAKRASSIPDGRYAAAEEVAELMLYLVSDHARHITGQGVHINGGAYAI